MFRANTNHKQQSISDNTQWMSNKTLNKLEKSWAPIFYENVFCKIDEEPFAVLYSTTGRPNFPINILLSLEYIKHMKNCSDVELIDYFDFDYLVNYAMGIRTLGEMNLAPRTLYYFRESVYQYCLENPEKEDLLFGQFVKLLKSFAQLAGILMDEQRTDTTLLMSNIKKAGRISLAYDVLVKAVKAIMEENRTDSLAKVLDPAFKTDVLYRSKSQEGDSKLAALLDLCQEALLILKTQPGMENSEEVRIVERFLGEQSTTDSESGKLIPKPKKEISSDSLQSAYDEDATFRKKGNVSQSGYVLEISETCNKDNPFQLITDYTLKPNNVSDVKILPERLPIIKENTGCTDMNVDGAFHSEKVYQAAEKAEIKIHLTNMTGTEPTKKIPLSEFDIDKTTNIINKCPGGHIPSRTGVSGGQTSAHFPHEACDNCEFRDQCYSKKQVKDSVVRISIKAIDTSRKREIMKEARKENTSMRAGIEGTNSALKRKGLDKVEVRGGIKTSIVSGLKVTVQNIKRMIKYKQGGYKPKIINKAPSGISMPICC